MLTRSRARRRLACCLEEISNETMFVAVNGDDAGRAGFWC